MIVTRSPVARIAQIMNTSNILTLEGLRFVHSGCGQPGKGASGSSVPFVWWNLKQAELCMTGQMQLKRAHVHWRRTFMFLMSGLRRVETACRSAAEELLLCGFQLVRTRQVARSYEDQLEGTRITDEPMFPIRAEHNIIGQNRRVLPSAKYKY